MGFLEARPLEFRDFSGGLTDNFLLGDPKRYVKADNFIITVDRKLEVRQGTLLYDPTGYSLPGASGSRVTSLFTAINETILFGHADRNLYTQSPDASYGNVWAAILGPTGNEALGAGDKYSQLSLAEFQRQIYYTSDARTQPGKLFRDENNSWKAVTAGLPRLSWSYDLDATLLAKCITLANGIRESMINHFKDHAGITSGFTTTAQHNYIDKYSLSYLESVSFTVGVDPEYPGPTPAPTPAPAATTEATLYTLCLALSLAYEHHRNDLAGQTPSTSGRGTQSYHQRIVYRTDYATGLDGDRPSVLGINAKLTLSGIVTTLTKAAALLDQLAQRWYWHQLSPLSHSPTNDWSMMSKFLVTAPKIGTLYANAFTVQVQPNYDDFIAFATWLKTAWNLHAMNTTSIQPMHSQGDTLWTKITLPDPVDFDSSALAIFWCRYLYGKIHVYDSNYSTYYAITFSTTSGSNTITAVSGTGAFTIPVGTWIAVESGLFPASDAVRVLTNNGAGTITLSQNCSFTQVGVRGTYAAEGGVGGGSWWHMYATSGSLTDVDVEDYGASESEFLSTGPGAVGSDLNTWVTLGNEFILAFGSHVHSDHSHYYPGSLYADLTGTSVVNGNPFFIPQVVTLAWAGFYRYQYTVEPTGQIYVNEGTPDFSLSVQTCATFPVNTVLESTNEIYYSNAMISRQNACATITGIPALANTSITNYDTLTSVVPIPETGWAPDLTIELYRTTDGGTTFYYLDSIANGTTSYADLENESYANAGDTALNTRKTIYTSGNVVANDSPPMCKYVHQFQGFTYYGAIEDTGQFFPQRLRQSKSNNPDSSPATFYDDLEDELTGLSSTRSSLLGFCKSSIYRFSGSFTSTGQGSILHERIADEVGCLNAKSIVKTEIGVFFAGTDGFYYTDGYQLIKLSIDLNATYASFTQSDQQKARIYGAYDKLTRRVWWAMQSSPNSGDNDTFFIFYLDYGVKPAGVFTKALTTESWMPASAVFYKGRLIIGDSRGYLFKTDWFTKTDPLVNTALAPSLWQTTHVPWAFRSCALDFGTTFKGKWVTKIHTIGQNVGNASIQINSINDANAAPNGSSGTSALPPIQYTKNLTWGDPTVVWGDASVAWKYDGAMDVWRRFPAASMRSDFKQIEYVPGEFVVYRSDDYPDFSTANVSASGLTATLATPAGYTSLTWPLDVVGMAISFDTDNYATEYPITALGVSNTRLTLTDADTTLSDNAAAQWQITGVRKNQRLRITAIDVHFSYLGEPGDAYPGATGAAGRGTNA